MAAPLAQSLPVRSSTPQPDVPANPFAVRVHPDACMEVGRMPDGASPRGDVSMSPSQHAAMCDTREGHRLNHSARLHPRMYSGAPAGARAMYASYVDPEPACSPSNSPTPPQLTSDGFNVQMYSEPARLHPRHAVGMDLDPHSDTLARKNVSASHGSTATGLGLFPVADIGASPVLCCTRNLVLCLTDTLCTLPPCVDGGPGAPPLPTLIVARLISSTV